MHQIYGAVEICVSGEWYEVINVSTLLMQHADLNGCLFGVDNFAGYRPLYADRGLPPDCADTLRARGEPFIDEDSHPSWALWSELRIVDWDERAMRNDARITEVLGEGGEERAVTKWLNEPRLQVVQDALERELDRTVTFEGRTFKRPILTRGDCLVGTDFPLVMKLMGCLAERFGDIGVRLTVWFG